MHILIDVKLLISNNDVTYHSLDKNFKNINPDSRVTLRPEARE